MDGKLIYSCHGKALKELGRVKLRWNLQMKVVKHDVSDIMLYVPLNILVLLSKG